MLEETRIKILEIERQAQQHHFALQLYGAAIGFLIQEAYCAFPNKTEGDFIQGRMLFKSKPSCKGRNIACIMCLDSDEPPFPRATLLTMASHSIYAKPHICLYDANCMSATERAIVLIQQSYEMICKTSVLVPMARAKERIREIPHRIFELMYEKEWSSAIYARASKISKAVGRSDLKPYEIRRVEFSEYDGALDAMLGTTPSPAVQAFREAALCLAANLFFWEAKFEITEDQVLPQLFRSAYAA